MYEGVDPVTLEIVQNRLNQIGREAGLVLAKTAASPVAVEAKDLGFNIADPEGKSVVYSVWMPRHGTTLGYLLKNCLREYEGDIHPGDVYMSNDPHLGALHLNDITVMAPIHVDKRLVAWAGCATHHSDIGGMTPGWSPLATNWYQEGIKFPIVRLVSGGSLNKDVLKVFLANVRLPNFQVHDLLAQVASVNFAREKVEQLARRYGVETLLQCYEEIIQYGEEQARARIREIRDGIYSYTEYLDYQELHAIRCTLTVSGEEMHLDFTGTDPAARASLNAALPCSVANIHNIYTCLLLPDLLANEGSFRPLHITIPPDTLLSCSPPTPSSGASVQAGWKAQCAAIGVFSQALSASKNWQRASAGWGSGFAAVQVSGRYQGDGFTLNIVDGSLQGGGARASKDGVEACNIAGSTNSSIPNVETYEQRYPILFLYRRLRPDSGGPGKFRGGVGGEFALAPHRVEKMEVLGFYLGNVIPANGLAGGFPGATTHLYLKRQTDLRARLATGVPLFADLAGEFQDLGCLSPPQILGPHDVLLNCCQGGGGFGDPLERGETSVELDVRRGLVSPAQAGAVYGVVFRPNSLVIDPDATRKERQRIRQARLQKEGQVRPWCSPSLVPGYLLRDKEGGSKLPGCGDDLRGELPEELQIRCAACGAILSLYPEGYVWRQDVHASYFGVDIHPHPQVGFFLELCPGCGRILQAGWEAHAPINSDKA